MYWGNNEGLVIFWFAFLVPNKSTYKAIFRTFIESKIHRKRITRTVIQLWTSAFFIKWVIHIGSQLLPTLREKCPNAELLLVRIFLYFRTEYRKIRTRNNFVFGHFSRIVTFSDWDRKYLKIYESYFRKKFIETFIVYATVGERSFRW